MGQARGQGWSSAVGSTGAWSAAANGREQLTPDWPDELAAELAAINDDLIRAVAAFTRRWFSEVHTVHRRAMTFALLDLPSSAIRRYLVAGKPPPESLDPSIRAAARAALDEADLRRPPRRAC